MGLAGLANFCVRKKITFGNRLSVISDNENPTKAAHIDTSVFSIKNSFR
jgi:hypothetical protein